MKKPKHNARTRRQMIDELYERYSEPRSRSSKLKYISKKYVWLFVVQSSYFIKRLLDVTVSLISIIAFSPLILIISSIIKCSDGGDILYVTQRVGKWGVSFPFPKFRTMVANADKIKEELLKHSDDIDPKRFKMKKDPRITTIGRLIRKTSLDELPQLWCVLKGDMSLVGPRPPLPEEVNHYTIDERRRLDIKPGITCFWQVSGRSTLPFDEQVKLDIKYIESQNATLDVKLLLQTIPAVIFGKGAY
jgi:lipopolysaccharide/colanic/teichoic acid biosynthesis glycosyltransferase